MPRQKGIVRIVGSLSGYTFYEKDGKGFVREDTSVDKQRIENSPEFRRTRENMQEFGGSAMAGKALRLSLAALMNSFRSKNLSARVTAIMRGIVSLGAGLRGKRDIALSISGGRLIGFNFVPATPFDSTLNAPYTHSVDPSRITAFWDIPDFNTTDYLRVPGGATHFRLIHAIAAISDYWYNDTDNKYAPAVAAENSISDIAYSPIIPIGGMVGSITSLAPALPGLSALSPDAALVSLIGVEFFQEVNGNHFLLAAGNALKIIAVS
jgi:hypothetical protein